MRRTWLLALALLAQAGWAAEAELGELLGRIRQSGAAEFRYEETRTLELATAPVRSSGHMLLGTDGSLVKLQLLPKRVIMAVAGERMWYWDPELKERHAAPLGQAGTAGQIIVLRALLQGEADRLKPSFDFAVERHGKHWRVRVSPKPGANDTDAPSIELSVDENQPKREILVRQGDGETARYSMEKTAEGPNLDYSIQRLLEEAAGE